MGAPRQLCRTKKNTNSKDIRNNFSQLWVTEDTTVEYLFLLGALVMQCLHSTKWMAC